MKAIDKYELEFNNLNPEDYDVIFERASNSAVTRSYNLYKYPEDISAEKVADMIEPFNFSADWYYKTNDYKVLHVYID